MSVNICIKDESLVDVPEWDWARYAGDRDFATLAWVLPYISKTIGHPIDCEMMIRPTDFPVWRKAVADLENPDRFMTLIDLLEENPTYWIYLSY